MASFPDPGYDSKEVKADGRRYPIALLRLGFRPFYLLAGVFAIISIPVWMAVYFGQLPPPTRYPLTLWHAHEMLYGYTVAVIVGFLFTAVFNWTGKLTPTGIPLALFAMLWLAGRIVMYSDVVPALITASIDIAFLPLVAVAIFIPIIRTANYRNLGIVVIVLLLAATNILFHLASFQSIHYPPLDAIAAGLALVVLMMIIIGGRVIPAFTANALPESGARRDDRFEFPSIAAVVLVFILLAVPALNFLAPAVLLLAGGLNAFRILPWGSKSTTHVPILWILHIGFIWIIIGLILAGLSGYTALIPRSAAIHALTTGAIGSMTLGMMTRTALGHSGRPLILPPYISWSYVLINITAVIRVISTMLTVELQGYVLGTATVTWVSAFLIFVIVYWSILTQPRVDGKPG